jgi:hypothetical protein
MGSSSPVVALLMLHSSSSVYWRHISAAATSGDSRDRADPGFCRHTAPWLLLHTVQEAVFRIIAECWTSPAVITYTLTLRIRIAKMIKKLREGGLETRPKAPQHFSSHGHRTYLQEHGVHFVIYLAGPRLETGTLHLCVSCPTIFKTGNWGRWGFCWIHLAHDKVQLQAVMSTWMNLRVP